MKTISQVMFERTRLIRNDPFYRHKLAMRDEPNFDNDKPEPTREIVEHRIIEDGHQIKAQLFSLEKRLLKHIDESKKSPGTMYE